MAKQRVFGLDALKALAAFFVVLYHVGMVDLGYREGDYYYPTLTQVLWLFCGCGVPLFFMINGALTVSKRYDLKKTAIKVGRLLFVAVFWAIVTKSVHSVAHNEPLSFPVIFKSLRYYWFLYSLAYFYVINYILERFPGWCRWACVAALLLFPFLTNLVWDFVVLFNPDTVQPWWSHVGVYTLYGLVYLYAGDHLMHHRCKPWVLWICAAIGLALLSLEAMAVVNSTHEQFEGGNYCFPTVGALMLSIALFAMIKDCQLRDSWFRRFVTFLGNNALGIYIFHLLLMNVVVMLWPQVSGMVVHPIVAIVIALAYMVASSVISELINRSPVKMLLRL